jgi:hypothetical protein
MFNCDLCTKIFSTNQMLRYHKDNKVCVTISCEYCDKSCININWYNKHLKKCEKFKLVSDGKYMCSSCKKFFSAKRSRDRHVSDICPVYKTKNIDLLNEKVDKLTTKMTELTEFINNNVTDNITNNGTVNNITNNGTVNNVTNITNVTINLFGKEDISYMNVNHKLKILNDVFKSIRSYVNEVHFNKKHPENQNIRMKSLRRNDMEMYRNDVNKWELIRIKDGVDLIIDEGYGNIMEFYEECKTRLSDFKLRRLKDFINLYENGDENLKRTIMRDVSFAIKNSRNKLSQVK